MSKEEVRHKFDEIVAFAEVEKFIDTPVKRYSSGMYVRLAFAVAAHLEPEILLVDEVLAVGDAEFQKKCLGKMGDVAKGGRTVLFVSHNLSAVSSLCANSILIENGKLILKDNSSLVINVYTNKTSKYSNDGLINTLDISKRSGNGQGKINQVELFNSANERTNNFGIGESILVKIHFSTKQNINRIVAGLEIKKTDGLPLINLRSDSQGVSFALSSQKTLHQISILIPGLPLYPGNYSIEPWIAEAQGRRLDHIHEGILMNLQPKGETKSESFIQIGRGIILIDCLWDYSL